MSRSRKKVAAHSMTCFGTRGDSKWKHNERRRMRRINQVRVQQGQEPLIDCENHIHDWWSSPSDGRVIYHYAPNPNTADDHEMRWWRKCLRK